DVKQPDGSVGFWEDLLAYGEEVDFSSECNIRGMHILQLPVVWEHMQSQTFTSNPAQLIRPKLSPYLDEANYGRLTRTYPRIFVTNDLCSGRTGLKTKLYTAIRRSKSPRGIAKL